MTKSDHPVPSLGVENDAAPLPPSASAGNNIVSASTSLFEETFEDHCWLKNSCVTLKRLPGRKREVCKFALRRLQMGEPCGKENKAEFPGSPELSEAVKK